MLNTLRDLDPQELDLVGGGAAGVDTTGTGDNASSHSYGKGNMCNYIMVSPGTPTQPTHEKMS
jgi:hypothetical protein